MRKSLTIGGALLALAAFASTADARMMGGGGGMGMHVDVARAPISSSMSSFVDGIAPRLQPGRTHLQRERAHLQPRRIPDKVKGSNWKKPIDSDGGGRDDPQPKPPKTPTQTSDGSGGGWHQHGPYGGYYGGWGHHHGGHYGPYPNSGSDGNVPQRDCRGC